jgi:hypothetical protein
LGFESQAFDRALHGQHGGFENIQPIDFLNTSLCYAKAQRAGDDFVVELFAFWSG